MDEILEISLDDDPANENWLRGLPSTKEGLLRWLEEREIPLEVFLSNAGEIPMSPALRGIVDDMTREQKEE